MTERYCVMGFARPRSRWFAEVGQWSMSGAIPVEFIKCVSTAEMAARIEAAAGISAVLLDGLGHGVDRDLLAMSRDHSVAAIVVDDTSSRDWRQLGAAAVLESGFGPEELVTALRETATPLRSIAEVRRLRPDVAAAEFAAPLVTVVGVRGAGASTIAAATAQGLARRADGRGSVLLADFALDAMQSTYHDAHDVVPAVQELVEAHRGGDVDRAGLRRCTFEVERRGYSLLIGLRRPRDWTALPTRSVDAVLASLRGAFRWVVADCTPEFDGDSETGSVDLEERNHLARRCARSASAVLAVGAPGVRGVRQLVRLLDDLGDLGVAPERVVPVINFAPRSPRARAEITQAIAQLASVAPPTAALHVPLRRSVELIHRGVHPFPAGLTSAVVASVLHVVQTNNARTEMDEPSAVPHMVAVAR